MQTIVHIAIRLLETAFFLGLAGSVIVVVISFIEDFAVLVEQDKK
jgi:hypothetical protein